MPRANRFIQPGLIYHLTHRCHDRSFLLRFACDRSEYRELLRQASRRFGVSLLNYSLTSNHSHIIAVESWLGGISKMMQKMEGEFASYYNRRKGRRGAYWEDRFHCTMVEDGEHLQNCMIYVDLNMVRANVVTHPRDWPWCGYHELVGERNRYRLLDLERLEALMANIGAGGFLQDYEANIQHAIQLGRFKREACWTESIAVGSESYVRRIAEAIRYERRKPTIKEEKYGVWIIRESPSRYHVRNSSVCPRDRQTQN